MQGNQAQSSNNITTVILGATFAAACVLIIILGLLWSGYGFVINISPIMSMSILAHGSAGDSVLAQLHDYDKTGQIDAHKVHNATSATTTHFSPL